MKTIRVCNSRACSSFGADDIMQSIKKGIGLEVGDKTEEYDLDYCGCLGWCSNAPNVEVDNTKIIMDCETDSVVQRIDNGEGTDMSAAEITAVPIKDDFLGDI